MHPFSLRLLLSPELALVRRLLVVLLWLTALAGCAAHRQQSTAGENLGRGLREYCELPRGARDLVQASIDRNVAPNRVIVSCAGDVDVDVDDGPPPGFCEQREAPGRVLLICTPPSSSTSAAAAEGNRKVSPALKHEVLRDELRRAAPSQP